MTHDGLLRRVRGQDQSTGSGPVRATVWRLRRNLGEDASTHTCFFAEPRVGCRMARGRERWRCTRYAGRETKVRDAEIESWA